jgi:hypothetical protein
MHNLLIRWEYLVYSISWHHITKANGTERDEAKVESVQEVPALPLPEYDGPATDVPNHHSQAQGDWHRHLHKINDKLIND